MPTYTLLAMLKPDTKASALANLFRGVARVVYRERGQFRTIENLGVRPLAFRHTQRGGGHYEDARFVECRYDVSPSGLSTVEQRLALSSDLIRWTHMREEGFQPGKKDRRKRIVGVIRLDSPTFDVDRYSPVGEDGAAKPLWDAADEEAAYDSDEDLAAAEAAEAAAARLDDDSDSEGIDEDRRLAAWAQKRRM
mmetsp:Transcript_19900/g.56218  ORF Transcript_19900/g.56218 Transcript_19900/m.56218 type:complete len:194 (+) Transcript_19900:121-702(+)